ncbi:MAG: adenosylcobinamide-GDP ribazoletransferase [Frankiaceae bacterium]
MSPPVLDGLRLAVTTFTVLPLRPGRVDRATARLAMAWTPLVGAGLGLVVAAGLFGSRIIFADEPGPLLPAAIAVALLALLTRGLHLDGLADTVDGLASHLPADRALRIMRSPEIGPIGLVAVVLVLLLQVNALTVCVANHRSTESVLLAVLAGRLTVLWSCLRGTPAARPDGLGALVAGTTRRPLAVLWTIAVAVEAWVYGRLDRDAGTVRGGLRAVGALLLALGIVWVLRRHVVRRLGGITGDVLGAQVEIAQASVLILMAVQFAATR